MAHTRLFARLKRAYLLSKLAEQKNVSPQQILDMQEQFRASRRKFIGNTAKVGALLSAGSLVSSFSGCKKEGTYKGDKIIAIVGGGISGLNAAYQLKKKGVNSVVLEASSRPGGRMLSKTDLIATGITTEVGAEFVDTNHEDMLALIEEFGLKMIDVTLDTSGGKETFFINNQHYSLEEVIDAFSQVAPKIAADQASIDEDYSNDATITLDNTDLRSYLSNLGGESWFSRMLDYAYLAEFGIETAEQSALNFVDFISSEVVEDEFKIFGESDERFKVIGGNQRVCEELYKRVKDQVVFDRKLASLVKEGNKYKLTFEGGGVFTADIVIMTMPYTILREIEFDIPEMSTEKRQCIDELGYGSNAKIMFGFNKRAWREQGKQGYLFNEDIQNGWDHGHMQNGNNGNTGYTVFVGGVKGIEANTKPLGELKDFYLPILDTIYPGSKDSHNNKSHIAKWVTNPLVKASYPSYKVGQWTTISGLEIEPVGDVYFAGDHCSDEFQGYMNGGAQTGRMAAEAVLERLGVK